MGRQIPLLRPQLSNWSSSVVERKDAIDERIEVLLEAACSDADIVAVARVFEAANIPADIPREMLYESAWELPWLVVIVFVG
jgi:hypothetical protein